MSNTITAEAAAMGATGASAVGTGPTPGQTASENSAITNPYDIQYLNNLKQWTLNSLQRMRNFRRPYDQRRAYFYGQYIGWRKGKLYPDNLTPRANTFVPYPKSNTETVVARILDAFFSIDPPFEVRTRNGNDYGAQQLQLVELTCLHRAKWIKTLEVFARDLCIYGHAAIKVDWDWDYEMVTGPEPIYALQPVIDPNTQQPILDVQTGQPIMLPVTGPDGQPIIMKTQVVSKRVPRNTVKVTPIDIYDLLIDPDEKIIGQVSEISWGQLKREAENNPDRYFPEAIAELAGKLNQYREMDRDGIIIRRAEVWDETKQTVTEMTFGEDADAIGWKDRRYQYRNASYSAYKRRIYNGTPVLLYHGPNPFAHKRCPILHTAYTKVKGDVYGIGLIESISDLTEGVNVFTNMITDNWNLGINKRYAYDVQMDIDHEALNLANVPGGRVGVVGDPTKVLFPLPSFTPNIQDYTIVDLYKGMIEMTSGISDFYAKGIGSTKGNRTSSGISQVINESGYIFRMLIRNMENDILQPLLELTAALIQQYGTDEMEWSITNAPPGIPKYGRTKLENLIGSYDFDFVGANYATGKVVKQRNLMAFYQIAMQSPYCNQGEFLREISKAMEIPYANRLLKSEQQVQQEQQQKQASMMQQMIAEKLLDFESGALQKAIAKKEPNSATQHALEVQKVVEDYLAEQAGIPVEGGPPENSMHEGRPATDQPEGQIPGMEEPNSQRSFAQDMGANSLGTAGM